MQKVLVVLVLLATTTVVRADDDADFDEDAADAAPAMPDAVGVQLELLPFGSLHHASLATRSAGRDHRDHPAGRDHRDPAAIAPNPTSYGVTVDLEHARSEHVSVGLSPRLVVNDDTDSQEVDLRLRLRYHHTVAPGLEAYGFLSPGYVFVIGSVNLHGPAIVVGGGATYDIAPNAFVSAEVGLQVARVASADQSVGHGSNERYVDIGIGAGTRF